MAESIDKIGSNFDIARQIITGLLNTVAQSEKIGVCFVDDDVVIINQYEMPMFKILKPEEASIFERTPNIPTVWVDIERNENVSNMYKFYKKHVETEHDTHFPPPDANHTRVDWDEKFKKANKVTKKKMDES